MKAHTGLAIFAILTAVVEVTFYKALQYPEPIPAIGFIMCVIAALRYACDR
jgi:hypothetical protein